MILHFQFSMRSLYFLLPGTTQSFFCGGLFAELKAMRLAQQVCSAEVVTYRQREADHLFLEDVLRSPTPNAIFVVSWGFDVPKLASKLRGRSVIYHAHSANYGFTLPAEIPIITVSRNTLGYWGQLAPTSLLYYLPNQISDEFTNRGGDREIDVLVHARKSSQYLMQHLVPALRSHCRVEVIEGFVPDLAELFNRSRVYLYDSAEYWATQGVTEGFGLQPLEAIACGCQVFSSVNHGLSDYLDPGFNCHKIAGCSLEFDRDRILKVIKKFQPIAFPANFLAEYRVANILHRWQVILAEVNDFFDHQQVHQRSQQQLIAPLTKSRVLQLRFQRLMAKVRSKLGRS
ncbi:MAG: glycosyltransferase [Synechococcales bacterium]|nr:glycosyltransferase [Synechococcales bacterium]